MAKYRVAVLPGDGVGKEVIDAALIEAAGRLESAVARVIKEGQTKTYDMGGTRGTLEAVEAVAGYL